MDTKIIGERIKYARSLRNLTLDDIANEIGVAKSTVQRYENGLIGKPKLPVLQAIADSLKVNPTWLSGHDVPMEIPSLRFETTMPDTPWNRALTKLQTGETLTDEEASALHNGLPDAVAKYKQAMLNFANQWNKQYFEKQMLESFFLLSNDNKKKVINYSDNLLNIQRMEEEQFHLMPNAAHERTDIEVTDEMRKHDDDLMDNDDLW